MVAYNFHKRFADLIISGEKCRTVRTKRRRPTRPGDRLQLYTGMRTRHCRKLLATDPVCEQVDDIEIGVTSLISAGIAYIRINGRFLRSTEIEIFAHNDGFRRGPLSWSARHAMGSFWLRAYGAGQFTGEVIFWTAHHDR